MLQLALSVLVAASTTSALATSYWITQQIEKIEQAPIFESVGSFAPPAIQHQEQPESVGSFAPPAIQHQEQPPVPAQQSAINLVFKFEEKTALENLAARSNGHLLLTSTNHPCLHYLNPQGGSSAKMLEEFPEATSTTGIVELTPDFFIVAVGNYSEVTFAGVPGSFSVWSVDLNPSKPKFKKITAIPEANALNGMTTLEGVSDVVLISDSSVGGIWRLNVTSGKYDMPMKHVLFTNCTSKFPLGINGIQTYEGSLYFVNSAQQIYGSLTIDATGNPTSQPTILARAAPGIFSWDDLAIDWEGNAWIATHANMVTEVTVSGKQRNFTGDDDSTDMKQPTSIIWGRGSQSASKTLYIITAGAGQVLTLDTRMIT